MAAVERSYCYSDVIRALGLRPAGGNHFSARRHIERLGLDVSHFNRESQLRGLRSRHERTDLSDHEIFCEASRVLGRSLRSRARSRLVPQCCAFCGNAGEWQGRPLTLQLDHANGRYDDNRLENLRWLCPNCHSQTPTFAGRGKVRRVREAPAFYAARARPGRTALRRPLPC